MTKKGHKKNKLLALLARSQSKKSTQALATSTTATSTGPTVEPASHRGPALVPFHYYTRLGFYSPVPVSLYSRILLVGEGNFSFAYSLLSYLDRSRSDSKVEPNETFCFLATCYEAETELYAKYPESRQYISDISSLGGHVLFKVDATALEKDKRISQSKPFTRIIFNFPHTGKGIKDQDRNIAHHQQFLQDFFRSAAALLSSSSSLLARAQKEKKRHQSNGSASEFSDAIKKDYFSLLDPHNLSYRTVYLIPQESDVLVPKTRVSQTRRKRTYGPRGASSDEESSSEGQRNHRDNHSDDNDGDDTMMDIDDSDSIRMKECPEIHVTLKSGLPYSQWNIKNIARSIELPSLLSLECRESFNFVRSKYACYTHVNTIGHFKSKMERSQDTGTFEPMLAASATATLSGSDSGYDSDSSVGERQESSGYEQLPFGQEDHLKGKQCKTFVFVLSEKTTNVNMNNVKPTEKTFKKTKNC